MPTRGSPVDALDYGIAAAFGLGLAWLFTSRPAKAGIKPKAPGKQPAPPPHMTIPPGSVIANWPQDAAGRSAAVLQAVKDGRADLDWFTIGTTAGNLRARIRVSNAMRVDGVIVNADQRAYQEVADYLGLVSFTPKLADEVYKQSTVRIAPQAQIWYKDGSMGLTRRMVDYSGIIDSAVDGRSGLVDNPGKYWVLVAALWAAGTNPKTGIPWRSSAANYGWYQTLTNLLQGLGFAHNLAHADYSQVFRYWDPDVQASDDGGMTWQSIDGRTMLTSPKWYPLVSAQQLPGYRHPGVPG